MVQLDGEAAAKDLRNKVWLALTGLSRVHFGMRIVFSDPGYVEMSPVNAFGLLLLQLAQAIVRADPSGPQIRTSRCRYCGASIQVKRRHPNGVPVRQYCDAKCKAAANYRARLARRGLSAVTSTQLLDKTEWPPLRWPEDNEDWLKHPKGAEPPAVRELA